VFVLVYKFCRNLFFYDLAEDTVQIALHVTSSPLPAKSV
jgi:hypothetical protein